MKFKKISAIIGGFLMIGMTAGIATAASFPAPFVQSGVADVAIVYGTGTGVSALDQTYATNIQTTLGESMPSTGGSVTDGDSYKFEKTSTAYHLGDGYTTIKSTIDKDELGDLLADGKYLDDDNDEIDYTQKIVMASASTLTMFDDDDYMENSPSVGFKLTDGATIATYTLTFTDTLLMTDMPTSDLPIMGKSYYVLSNTSTTLTLLDAAATATVAAGESVTLDVEGTTYTVSASIFDTVNSKVKLSINGETTNLLAGTETQKLTDGAYVGVKEVIVQNFQGGTNQVEFSIGKGKLKLSDTDTEIQINDVNVAGVESDFSLSGNTLSNIEIVWKANDDLYITETNTETMPGFEAVSLAFGGLNYPAEETIEVVKGGTTYGQLNNFPLKTGTHDINLVYGDSTSFTGLGKDATHKLLTDANSDVNITFNKSRDDYFVASWTDGETSQSYLMKATNVITDTSDKADIQYWNDNDWSTVKEKAVAGDTFSMDSIDLTVGVVNNTLDTVELWNTTANAATSTVSFNTLYSEEGLTVYLPWENTTATTYNNATGYATATAACTAFNAANTWNTGEIFTGTMSYNDTSSVVAGVQGTTAACATSFGLVAIEEDKSGNAASGDWINLTLGWDSSSTAEVEVNGVATSNTDATAAEIGSTDVWRDFTYSALATEILWNKPSSGQKSVKLIYHGEEVAADVYITSPGATVGGPSSLGNVLVKDSEVSSVSDKNLVIVGGSCINAAAATALGVAEHTCGADFTAATGVSSGQFLIQSVADAFTSGKIAIVVAGYDVTDTNNAATYLRTKDVDTSAGNKYVGTTATEAKLQVTE